jgi:hypothetical protein
MMRAGAVVLALCACGGRLKTPPPSAAKGDDVTLYRDVAVIRQRVEVDLPATPTTIEVKVAAGTRADQVVLLDRGGVVVTAIHGPTDPDKTADRSERDLSPDMELDEAPASEPEELVTDKLEDELAKLAKLEAGKPVTLRLDVDAPAAGRYALQLGYATDKLGWDVAYTITANPSRDRAIVRGALAVRNTTGITIKASTTRVVDAELGAWRGKTAEQLAATLVGGTQSSTPPAEPRELGPLELGAGESRVELIGSLARTMKAVLVYDPIGTKHDHSAPTPVTDPALGTLPKAPPRVTDSFEVQRKSAGSGGFPAGPVRLLEGRADGSLVVLGEARLFDAATRAADLDTIAVGTAEGVTGSRERRELSVDEEERRIVEEFVITIDNKRAHPIGVLVREHLYRGQNWTLAYHSAKSAAKEGPQQISLRATVPANSQGKIVYVVVYTWGQ